MQYARRPQELFSSAVPSKDRNMRPLRPAVPWQGSMQGTAGGSKEPSEASARTSANRYAGLSRRAALRRTIVDPAIM